MKSQQILEQGELADIIASVYQYNGMEATDVAFDISGDSLRVIVTVDAMPLKVRTMPETATGMDRMSAELLAKMTGGGSGVGRN